MWASEITKCFNEGRLGGSRMTTHQELSLPHVGPCGCMLTQTGGGGQGRRLIGYTPVYNKKKKEIKPVNHKGNQP